MVDRSLNNTLDIRLFRKIDVELVFLREVLGAVSPILRHTAEGPTAAWAVESRWHAPPLYLTG
jgi:hypothetical protein